MIETKSTTDQKRYLGFRHRVKMRIVDGEPTEPLPSEVVVLNNSGERIASYKLESEQAELDFINGIFPAKYRTPAADEDISNVEKRQIIWRPAREEDMFVQRHASQCVYKERRAKKGEPALPPELIEVAKEVPCEWTGLKPNDQLAMSLGGSGDYFALAASNKLHSMGGEVYRIPPFKLQNHRGTEPKDKDAELLAQVLFLKPDDFYPTVVRDKQIIMVRETFKIRMDAMKDRMACAQRLRQRLIGNVFCSTEGGFPDGDIEKRFEELKANDPIYTAVLAQEERALKAMSEAVEQTDVWQKLFADLPGVGPAIAARLISTIMDIRRFETAAKLKKFLGVHVLPDGTFPRRRNGVVANWSPDGRQALYLLQDQFVKKPKSEWGMKVTAYKAKFRQRHPGVCVQSSEYGLVSIGPSPQPKRKEYKTKHPTTGEEITVTGAQRYGDGHIHKMAVWRALTKFVEWLHREWWKLESGAKKTKLPTEAAA